MNNVKSICTWNGEPIESLSRDELLAVIKFLGDEARELKSERTRLFASIDPLKYLMNGK